jgi:hypothetical protein
LTLFTNFFIFINMAHFRLFRNKGGYADSISIPKIVNTDSILIDSDSTVRLIGVFCLGPSPTGPTCSPFLLSLAASMCVLDHTHVAYIFARRHLSHVDPPREHSEGHPACLGASPTACVSFTRAPVCPAPRLRPVHGF